MFDSQLVANAPDDEVDIILKRAWPVIKRRHRGQDHGPSIGARRKVSQLDPVEGRFARNQYQRTAFLQVHIGRALNEVLR